MTDTSLYIFIGVLALIICAMGWKIRKDGKEIASRDAKLKTANKLVTSLEARIEKVLEDIKTYSEELEKLQASNKEQEETYKDLTQKVNNLGEILDQVELLGPELRRYLPAAKYAQLQEKFSLLA